MGQTLNAPVLQAMFCARGYVVCYIRAAPHKLTQQQQQKTAIKQKHVVATRRALTPASPPELFGDWALWQWDYSY